MRPRIHTHVLADKIFNTAASPIEEEALRYKRFKQSHSEIKNYIFFFGIKKYIDHSECDKYTKTGIKVYTE